MNEKWNGSDLGDVGDCNAVLLDHHRPNPGIFRDTATNWLPVPLANVVEGLPRIQTRLAWREPIRHITDDPTIWENLWAGEKAVAESYGLNAGDFGHILDGFPGFARKRPEFMEFLRLQLDEWKRGL